jgi:hypothetical protein
MSYVDRGITAVLEGSPRDPLLEEGLRRIVAELERLGCRNIAEKLFEFKGGNFDDLLAELRLARSVSRHLGCPVDFQVGDVADIRFIVDGVDCLLEVVHKSSPHPWSAVFHPTPAALERYASGRDWERAAHRLHMLLADLPIAIQPWVDAKFVRPEVGWRARAEQENACGEVADWLAAQLVGAVEASRTELHYTDGVTRFDVTPLDVAPGYVKGHASLKAWDVNEGTLRDSIEKKNAKAKERLLASGAGCYLVGLAIDDALASRGDELLTTLFGPPVVCEGRLGGRTFRPVPASRRSRVDEARHRGRGALLDLAQFDPNKNNLYGQPEAVYFDPASAAVGGVLALYYTDALQFIPNPFSSNDIERVCLRFPAQLTPFSSRR